MSMVTKKYAAIDIGSNAVRLMIMLVHQTNESTFFKKVSLTRVPIRLGEDVFLKNKISRRNISRMIHAMKAFHHLIKLHEVINYSACATSAMRDSTNGTELVETIFEQTGLKINVISGKEEAEIIYQMHIEEKIDASKRNSDLEIKTIEFEIAKNNYKYVKIIAKKLGKVPEWHKGYPYDGRGWVFVDEISIK